MKAKRVKLDWDTVELVGQLARRSRMQQLMAGASMRARSRGSAHTHRQLRYFLHGMDVFIYSWGLVAAAMEDDPTRAIDRAARVIEEASRSCLSK